MFRSKFGVTASLVFKGKIAPKQKILSTSQFSTARIIWQSSDFYGKRENADRDLIRKYSSALQLKLEKTSKSPYYESSEDNYYVPPYCNFTTDFIDQWAHREKTGERSTDVPALWFLHDNNKEVKWTFTEVSRLAKKVANMLQNSCNLGKNDVIMIMLPRMPEWWILYAGAIRQGLTVALATSHLRSKDIGYRIREGKITCVATIPELMDEVDKVVEGSTVKAKIVVKSEADSQRINKKGWIDFHEAMNASSDDHEAELTKCTDPMLLYYTSGTTGNPKMVEHSYGNYHLVAQQTGKFLGLGPTDCKLTMSDTGWAFLSLGALFAPWSQGTCSVIPEMKGRFDPKKLIEILQKYPINKLSAAPTVYRLMLQHIPEKIAFRSLSYAMCAGEPLDEITFNKWKERTGIILHNCYGQSETTLMMGNFLDLPPKPGSIGKIFPHFPVHIVDDNENDVGPGVEGHIVVKIKPTRPWGLFNRYRNEPEKTKEAFKGLYYYTGDRAYYDEDGYCWSMGRADDVIKSSGYRIGPHEVEYALMEHPAVAEAAVIGSPDPQRGQVVKAFIILKDEYKERPKDELTKEIQEFVKNSTAVYKYPRKVEFVDDLPKTISGKVKRKELRLKEEAKYKQSANI